MKTLAFILLFLSYSSLALAKNCYFFWEARCFEFTGKGTIQEHLFLSEGHFIKTGVSADAGSCQLYMPALFEQNSIQQKATRIIDQYQARQQLCSTPFSQVSVQAFDSLDKALMAFKLRQQTSRQTRIHYLDAFNYLLPAETQAAP